MEGSKTTQGRTAHESVNRDYLQQYEVLYKAVRNGKLEATTYFLNDNPEAVTAKITSYGETALHVAVMFGHLNIIEELVKKMSKDDLKLVDNYGSTALHSATSDRNNLKVVEDMVGKNKELVTLPEKNDWIPVTLAFDYGNIKMARYLYSKTPLTVLLPENGSHGVKLLSQCYHNKEFDVALHLLQRCPRLAVTLNGPMQQGKTFLEDLATIHSAILNESLLPCWRRWICEWVHVHREPASSSTNEIYINISEANTGINNLYDTKIAHKQALEVLGAACDMISSLSEKEMDERGVYSSIISAAEHGIPEFIMQAIKVRLSLLWTRTATGGRIFHVAVQCRQAQVYNLIHGVIHKDRFPNFLDNDGNTLLHMAGMKAPSTYLNNISGAVLQMQRELQWFKEVESIMPPMRKEFVNRDGKTARQLFTDNHKDLVEEGEKWTKDTARSCTVVAALVATITFAAAFTIPGGNDQNTGYPILLHHSLFTLFIISDAVSLLSSSTSALVFLGLLTSRYAEDDFLKLLPTKLIIGLFTLFVSIATMMIAFGAKLFLLLHHKLWILISVTTLLAGAPVALYIWLQFPLLLEIFMSTYWPSIFHRKVKPWP